MNKTKNIRAENKRLRKALKQHKRYILQMDQALFRENLSKRWYRGLYLDILKNPSIPF